MNNFIGIQQFQNSRGGISNKMGGVGGGGMGWGDWRRDSMLEARYVIISCCLGHLSLASHNFFRRLILLICATGLMTRTTGLATVLYGPLV